MGERGGQIAWVECPQCTAAGTSPRRAPPTQTRMTARRGSRADNLVCSRTLVDLKHAHIVHALDLRASYAGEVVLEGARGMARGTRVTARTARVSIREGRCVKPVDTGHARPLSLPTPTLHSRPPHSGAAASLARVSSLCLGTTTSHGSTRRVAATARRGGAHLDLAPQGVCRWIVQHLAVQRVQRQRPEQHGAPRDTECVLHRRMPSLLTRNFRMRGAAGTAGAAGVGAGQAAKRGGAFVTQEEAEGAPATRVETAATVLGETLQAQTGRART